MIKYAVNPQGEQIEFHVKNHAYIFNGDRFKSVTTLIRKFFTPFDTEQISFFYAKKNGLDQAQVKKEWANIGKEACEFGKRVHSHVECLFKKEQPQLPINQKDETAFKYNEIYISKILNGYNFIEAEKIIFSKKFKLAGMVDIILECKKDGTIIIIDWKTTKLMEYNNSYGKYGYNGLEHLDDCNFNHYCLQLNIYKKILEEEQYYPNKNIRMGIVHVNDKIANHIRVPELRKEIEIML